MAKKILLKLTVFCLIIATAAVQGGCFSRLPADLIKANLFNLNYDEARDSIYLYIDWLNRTSNYTADQIEIVIEGQFDETYTDGNQMILRFLCTETVGPGMHGKITEPLQHLLVSEEYKIYIHQVRYTDGSYWDNENCEGSQKRLVNGTKGKGSFPVSLLEVNYYAQNSRTNADRDFNTLWKNDGTEMLRGVVYRVRACDENMQVIIGKDGRPHEAYIESFYSHMTFPGLNNPIYHYSMPVIKYRWIMHTPALEVSVVQAITEDGTVYETDDPVCICAGFLGKKGYAFLSEMDHGDIRDMIGSLEKEFSNYDLNYRDPRVMINHKHYCILRYDDLDIRLDLDENDKVKHTIVSYVLYLPQYSGDDEEWERINAIEDSLPYAVYSAVLTEIPHDELIEKIDEFPGSRQFHYDFSDREYRTFEERTIIMSPSGEQIIASIHGVGKDWNYYPSNALFWANDTIYDSQRLKTVPYRD